MLLRVLAAACCAALLASGATFAQTPAPAPAPAATASPATPPTDASARAPRTRRGRGAVPATSTDSTPAATAPATAPAAARPAAPAVLPAGTKVNLNTASAAQLDALPSVGKARLKAITDERAKGPFKDWDDFTRRMQHTSVNKGVQAKIKDYAIF